MAAAAAAAPSTNININKIAFQSELCLIFHSNKLHIVRFFLKSLLRKQLVFYLLHKYVYIQTINYNDTHRLGARDVYALRCAVVRIFRSSTYLPASWASIRSKALTCTSKCPCMSIYVRLTKTWNRNQTIVLLTVYWYRHVIFCFFFSISTVHFSWFFCLFLFSCLNLKGRVIRLSYSRARQICPFRCCCSCFCCVTVAKIVTHSTSLTNNSWPMCVCNALYAYSELLTFQTTIANISNFLQFKCSIISNFRSICTNSTNNEKKRNKLCVILLPIDFFLYSAYFSSSSPPAFFSRRSRLCQAHN